MNKDETLKITIITVCKNSARFLPETFDSVARQTYKNIQYIVVDGNSTDGTLDIIRQNAETLDTWLSENDNGMYDAINKGLQLATGDYILVLNSDDTLESIDTIKNLAAAIQEERLDYYYGNIIKLKGRKSKLVKLFDVNFTQLLLSTHGTFAPHPCFIISSAFNRQLGGYDPRYLYASDYDYILRALAAKNRKGKYLNMNISRFRIHEDSITASGRIENERKQILKRHGYYQHQYLNRVFVYFTLWIYYKIINLGRGYKAG